MRPNWKKPYRVLTVVAGLLISAAMLQAAPEKKPNIIMVVADDLSRTLCTFLPEGEGKTLMPTLERLAKEGKTKNEEPRTRNSL